MNAKTASSIINIPIHVFYKRCKKLGIKKTLVDFGHTKLKLYNFTNEDIDKIKYIKNIKTKKKNYYDILGREVGLKRYQVKAIVAKTKVGIKNNYAGLKLICLDWKTKEYTLKGLKKRHQERQKSTHF